MNTLHDYFFEELLEELMEDHLANAHLDEHLSDQVDSLDLMEQFLNLGQKETPRRNSTL